LERTEICVRDGQYRLIDHGRDTAQHEGDRRAQRIKNGMPRPDPIAIWVSWSIWRMVW